MASINTGIYSLNAGLVGLEALGRIDLAKMRMAAEVQTNLLPTVLGPAKFRPGLGYYTGTRGDADARLIPFVFNVTTKALVELTDGYARVLLDGVPLTRPTVSAAVTNGAFTSDLTGWTDADESGAVSDWNGGFMRLLGTGSNFAVRRQQVTVTETGTEHALRIVVERGPITFKVGTASDLDDYIAETSLRTGEHSLAFTPSGNFHITVSSVDTVHRLVESIEVEAAGVVTLPTLWASGAIPSIRHDQSGDVLYTACDGIRQQRIERRSQRSWSIVEYLALDGPFRAENTTATTITPSAVVGNITLTASRALFHSGHIGAIWRLTHYGQTATAVLSGDDQFTDYIRVTGTGGPVRTFHYSIVGAFSGTITRQRSFGEPGNWQDDEDFTAPTSGSLDDNFNNQIIYYRMGFKAGDYVSGTPTVTLTYPGALQNGVVRITAFSSSTSVSAEVVETLGLAEGTRVWAEGEWSDYRGYPGAVTFHDGRLWWGWRDKVYGSVSDAYESFDAETEGDSAPIVRSVATGGFERIFWMLSIQRLLAGTGAQEISIRASSFDEPLTTTQFTARAASDRGSADIQAAKVDSRGVYVQRNGTRVFELAFDTGTQDFNSQDLTRLCPEVCGAGVRSIAVQRQPDTRVWFVLDDGTAAVLTLEPSDEVVAWAPVSTTPGSSFKSVAVLPGEEEDEVWFVVERPVGVTNKHYIEKMARADDCVGSALSKNMDSYVVYEGASTATITGLGHLEGQEVVAWGNGFPRVTTVAPLTVTGGSITLPAAVPNAVVGLPYDGQFKSTKLAYAAQAGTALMMKKKVSRLGLLMKDICWDGIKHGRDFGNLSGFNRVYKGRELAPGETIGEYDQTLGSHDGGWDSDSRVCFLVSSPYPATFMGVVIAIETNEAMTIRPAGRGG